MNDTLWVFGYGSLIWRPGFEFAEQKPALLRGLHRALCLHSYVHRGTPERPGIVAGLDHGGACRGMAFRVENQHREPVLDYLREREQMNYCYLEKYRSIELSSEEGSQKVDALCFVVDRTHEQYCGDLPLKDKARLVIEGHGKSGAATEYLANLIESLKGLGIRDDGLITLQKEVETLQTTGREGHRAKRHPLQNSSI